ncbi:hypothetical protein HEK131_42320 [Streptomyces seoulensis]|nr:hypothetical protein HEK131_42320 [Streptomyces seoulensis]
MAELRQMTLPDRAGRAGRDQEGEHVGGDERVRHIRGAARGIDVMDGYDHTGTVPAFAPASPALGRRYRLARTFVTALRAATRTGSQTGENGGA